MNYGHVAHIIRDVFRPEDSVICYGKDEALALKSTLRSPEHGTEAFTLHSEKNTSSGRMWNLPFDNSHFGFNYCKLFISLGYAPSIDLETGATNMALRIASLMKPGGLILLLNPAIEYTVLIDMLTRRQDLEKKMKSYSEFMDQKVVVLER
jgi:hypothetical protein